MDLGKCYQSNIAGARPVGGAGRVHGTPITITQRDTFRVSDYATGCLQCTHGRAMHVSNSFESFDYVCTDLDYTVP